MTVVARAGRITGVASAREPKHPQSTLTVLIIGRGKVGSRLADALRRAGSSVATLSGRALEEKGTGRSSLRAALRRLQKHDEPRLCVIAVRDPHVATVAEAIAGVLEFVLPVVHTAGALGPEALRPIQDVGSPTAQMHPLLSFVAHHPTDFRGATLLLDGHPRAVAAARRVAKELGALPRSFPNLPKPLYHAAAALLANGAAALSESAVRFLEQGGVPRADAVQMLAPLLGSVAKNVLRVGLPEALSGPVRRGDLRAVAAHWRAIEWAGDHDKALYLASIAAQLVMAKSLGDASPTSMDALQNWVLERRSETPPGSLITHDAKRRWASQIKVPQSRSSASKNRAKR